MCWAKEFRFYILSNGEPLKILEQGMAFLEKDESGHGLWRGVAGNREPSKEEDGYNKWSMCNGKTSGGAGQGRLGK